MGMSGQSWDKNVIVETLEQPDGSKIYCTDTVIIGNGPSAMSLSAVLHGHRPFYDSKKRAHPIASLHNKLEELGPDKCILETDLLELADGLEGRTNNTISLLYDQLVRPEADVGHAHESCVDWRFIPDDGIPHIVIGRGKEGGSWQWFPDNIRTLSFASWLDLPAYSFAEYCAQQKPHSTGRHRAPSARHAERNRVSKPSIPQSPSAAVLTDYDDNAEFPAGSSRLRSHSTSAAKQLTETIPPWELPKPHLVPPRRPTYKSVQQYFEAYTRQLGLQPHFLNYSSVTSVVSMGRDEAGAESFEERDNLQCTSTNDVGEHVTVSSRIDNFAAEDDTVATALSSEMGSGVSRAAKSEHYKKVVLDNISEQLQHQQQLGQHQQQPQQTENQPLQEYANKNGLIPECNTGDVNTGDTSAFAAPGRAHFCFTSTFNNATNNCATTYTTTATTVADGTIATTATSATTTLGLTNGTDYLAKPMMSNNLGPINKISNQDPGSHFNLVTNSDSNFDTVPPSDTPPPAATNTSTTENLTSLQNQSGFRKVFDQNFNVNPGVDNQSYLNNSKQEHLLLADAVVGDATNNGNNNWINGAQHKATSNTNSNTFSRADSGRYNWQVETVQDGGGRLTLRCRRVVLATGTPNPRKIGAIGEQDFENKWIFYSVQALINQVPTSDPTDGLVQRGQNGAVAAEELSIGKTKIPGRKFGGVPNFNFELQHQAVTKLKIAEKSPFVPSTGLPRAISVPHGDPTFLGSMLAFSSLAASPKEISSLANLSGDIKIFSEFSGSSIAIKSNPNAISNTSRPILRDIANTNVNTSHPCVPYVQGPAMNLQTTQATTKLGTGSSSTASLTATPKSTEPPILIVGSGLSAADALVHLLASTNSETPVLHVYRHGAKDPQNTLARMSTSVVDAYPEYAFAAALLKGRRPLTASGRINSDYRRLPGYRVKRFFERYTSDSADAATLTKASTLTVKDIYQDYPKTDDNSTSATTNKLIERWVELEPILGLSSMRRVDKPKRPIVVRISYAIIMVGFEANLGAFLPPELVNAIADNPSRPIDGKSNTVLVNSATFAVAATEMEQSVDAGVSKGKPHLLEGVVENYRDDAGKGLKMRVPNTGMEKVGKNVHDTLVDGRCQCVQKWPRIEKEPSWDSETSRYFRDNNICAISGNKCYNGNGKDSGGKIGGPTKIRELYAIGPLIGDNFVRYGAGGAFAVGRSILQQE